MFPLFPVTCLPAAPVLPSRALIAILIMHLSLPSHLTTSCMCLCECVLKYVCGRNRRGLGGGRVYSFPLGSFKKEFRLQSNLHLILLGWPPAYIILHSCSAHMAQRELSLFYYRSDNLGPPSLALVIACPWVFFLLFFMAGYPIQSTTPQRPHCSTNWR